MRWEDIQGRAQKCVKNLDTSPASATPFEVCLFQCWLCWVFIAVCRLSLVALSKGLLSGSGAEASHCSGFPCCGAWARVGFSSCGRRTQLPCSMWSLPGERIKPMSPALAGGFLTTGPPRRSLTLFILVKLRGYFWTLGVEMLSQWSVVDCFSLHKLKKNVYVFPAWWPYALGNCFSNV